MKKFLTLGLLMISSIAFFGCAQTTPATTTSTQQITNGITIKNMSFTPQTFTIAAGTTITRTNEDSMNHTITADDGSFNGEVPANGNFSYTFDKAGTFAYHCGIHPSMKGTITVQ